MDECLRVFRRVGFFLGQEIVLWLPIICRWRPAAGVDWAIICERGTAMLMLSRKSRESVVIGDHNRFDRLLKVTVMEIGPGRVTLGFEVNENVPVQCEDAWERILAGDGSKAPRFGESRPGEDVSNLAAKHLR